MKKTKGILWGVAIIAVGIFWGLTASGTINVDLFFDGWWTLFIIIPSLVGLITDKNKTGSLILLLIGIVLAPSNYIDFARFKWIVWPAIVVIIGQSSLIMCLTTKPTTNLIRHRLFSRFPIQTVFTVRHSTIKILFLTAISEEQNSIPHLAE